MMNTADNAMRLNKFSYSFHFAYLVEVFSVIITKNCRLRCPCPLVASRVSSSTSSLPSPDCPHQTCRTDTTFACDQFKAFDVPSIRFSHAGAAALDVPRLTTSAPASFTDQVPDNARVPCAAGPKPPWLLHTFQHVNGFRKEFHVRVAPLKRRTKTHKRYRQLSCRFQCTSFRFQFGCL
jgi:hypothetical protein